VRIDTAHVLAAGFLGGGSTAAYQATTDPRLQSFAVLHGGVFAKSLGPHRAHAWFSTGETDPLRPPHVLRRAATAASAHSSDLSVQLFPGGTSLSDAEIEAVFSWWLGA
jgi:predicted esterase